MQKHLQMDPEMAVIFDTWTYLECWYIKGWKELGFFKTLNQKSNESF